MLASFSRGRRKDDGEEREKSLQCGGGGDYFWSTYRSIIVLCFVVWLVASLSLPGIVVYVAYWEASSRKVNGHHLCKSHPLSPSCITIIIINTRVM